MKTLVIHPPGDRSTYFLRAIYRGRKSWTVAEGDVERLIPRHERIIMLGHGCPDGLYNSNYNIVIGPEQAALLKNKICVCIWCHADLFVEAHQLKSPLYSGMFISEPAEAALFEVDASPREITRSNNLFARTAGNHITGKNILENVKRDYIGNSAVIAYNSERLYSNI